YTSRNDFAQYSADTMQDPVSDLGQRLLVSHDVQIKFGAEPEDLHHLIEHLPMLRGHADYWAQLLAALQAAHHRGHFDGLRTGAENDENFSHFGETSGSPENSLWLIVLRYLLREWSKQAELALAPARAAQPGRDSTLPVAEW